MRFFHFIHRENDLWTEKYFRLAWGITGLSHFFLCNWKQKKKKKAIYILRPNRSGKGRLELWPKHFFPPGESLVLFCFYPLEFQNIQASRAEVLSPLSKSWFAKSVSFKEVKRHIAALLELKSAENHMNTEWNNWKYEYKLKSASARRRFRRSASIRFLSIDWNGYRGGRFFPYSPDILYRAVLHVLFVNFYFSFRGCLGKCAVGKLIVVINVTFSFRFFLQWRIHPKTAQGKFCIFEKFFFN